MVLPPVALWAFKPEFMRLAMSLLELLFLAIDRKSSVIVLFFRPCGSEKCVINKYSDVMIP
jgi:hypothetical protein